MYLNLSEKAWFLVLETMPFPLYTIKQTGNK